MRPSFLPRLVNGPFDDPGLFIPFLLEKRAIIFDLGDIYSLSTRDILKISHVFISHTHIDHFIGFDRLLRLFLGREQQLYLYGPQGFLKNVEGKLAGYSWNLVKHYSNLFALNVTEVHPDHMITRNYICQNRFIPDSEDINHPFNGLLHKEPALSVSAEILDHSIPCLGFTIEERFHINIMKERVAVLGLEIGPWLNEFKQALYNNIDPDSKFEVRYGGQSSCTKKFILGDLAKRIALLTPGQKISYVVDAGYSKSNVKKIIKIAKNADHLFIEAAFLEKDKDIAEKKCHLTAWQAGSIAGKAGVKQVTPFHFSPRYKGLGDLLEKEAMDGYNRHIIM
ncbi:MAG: ribonuclease Z [Desulfobacteraceae bacterium Eth-SRB2]|nr:MAG: ribonuclease Z [Desulfobacteraceae bacterium Eth-SRB2]